MIHEGTVTIRLEDYESLRKFQEKMSTGNYLCFASYYRERENFYYVIASQDEIHNLHKDNESLSKQITELKSEVRKVKAMSIWQFIKFRRSVDSR